MADLTVYEKRTCTTCRKLSKLLDERGIEADKVDYFVEPLDEPRLRELLRKAGFVPATCCAPGRTPTTSFASPTASPTTRS